MRHQPDRVKAAWVLFFLMAAALIVLPLLLMSPARGASLSVPIPDGCVPQVAGYTVSCAGTTTPPPTTPPPTTPPPGPVGGAGACAANGYSMTSLEAIYPVTGNTQIPSTGTFGNYQAIVVHFRTPAKGVNDDALFQPAGFPPTQNTSRYYVLGTAPCLFTAGGAAIYDVASQSPAIKLSVGACPYSTATLCRLYGPFVAPSTDYYVTMVNRTGPNGQPSCATSSCPMRIDFNK